MLELCALLFFGSFIGGFRINCIVFVIEINETILFCVYAT